jgi:hypothetical protein
VVQRRTRPGIAYREVDDLEPSTLTVAWPETSRSAAVAAFVRVAGRVAAAHPSDRTWTELPTATGLIS